jgi:hypothetical protein
MLMVLQRASIVLPVAPAAALSTSCKHRQSPEVRSCSQVQQQLHDPKLVLQADCQANSAASHDNKKLSC